MDNFVYNQVIKKNYRELKQMKPRIFISSTFYDLKYIREDLASFVRSYDYEPIMFEEGDIGYISGKPIDEFCYESMRNADMVILIVGGEYGSPANGETKDEFKEYLSVTRKEFRTAVDAGIPIFVMIEKNTMAEYGVYELNYNIIENRKSDIIFPTVKNTNVFRFIRELKNIITIPIQVFDKSADIKQYLRRQWSDMFKNYLNLLKNNHKSTNIENSVEELKNLVRKMKVMLDSVGENILSEEDLLKYKFTVTHQEILSLCDYVTKNYRIGFYEKPEQILKDTSVKKELLSELLVNIKRHYDEENNNNNYISVGSYSDLFNNIFLKYGKINMETPGNISSVGVNFDLLSDDDCKEEIIKILLKDENFNRIFQFD